MKIVRIIICLLLAFAPPSFAAHTYDTKAQTATFANTNPTTLSYTCGAGTTLLVLKIQHTNASRTGGAPTYNGVAYTQVGAEVLNAQEVGVEMWYMPNPPTGSAYTISVPNAASGSMRITAASFKAQSGYTSALDQNTSTNVDGANPSLNRTTTVNGDACLDVLGHGYLNPPTARTHTLLYTNDEGALTFETQYALQASLGLITMSHTVATDDVAMIMACFKEVASSGATVVLAGSESTASAGSLNVSVAVAGTAALAGSGAASGAGDLSVTGTVSATAALSGDAATSAHGSLTMAAAATGDVALTGLGATAGNGSLGISGNAAIPLAGSGAVSAHGSLGVSGAGTITLSGQGMASSVGALGVFGNVQTALSGMGATASPGNLLVSAAGGASIPLSGNAVSASGGALFVSGNAAIPLAGSAATTGTGSLGVSTATLATLSGSAAASASGTLGVSGSGSVSLSGSVMLASAGNIAASVPGGFVPGRDKTKKIEIKGFKYLR